MLRACGIGREPLHTYFRCHVLSIRPLISLSSCSLQHSGVTCCSSVALATPSFCQLRLSVQRRGEERQVPLVGPQGVYSRGGGGTGASVHYLAQGPGREGWGGITQWVVEGVKV